MNHKGYTIYNNGDVFIFDPSSQTQYPRYSLYVDRTTGALTYTDSLGEQYTITGSLSPVSSIGFVDSSDPYPNLTAQGQGVLFQLDNSNGDLVFRDREGVLHNLTQTSSLVFQNLSDVTITSVGEESLVDAGGLGSVTRFANTSRVGTNGTFKCFGRISTANPNEDIKFRFKLLPNTITETDIINLTNLNSGDNLFEVTVNFTVRATGSAGSAALQAFGTFLFTRNNGVTQTYILEDLNNTTYDTTSTADFDVTSEWYGPGNTLDVKLLYFNKT